MRDENNIMELLDHISNNEILRLRKIYIDNENLDNYLSKTFEKIFKKLVFPYFRFEILQKCIIDIKNNYKYYPNINKKQIKKFNIIFNALQKICLHLNIALDEYHKVIMYVEKSMNYNRHS